MDIKQIKELAKTMRENGLTAVEITEGDKSLRMERQPAPAAVEALAPAETRVLMEKEGARPAPLATQGLNITEIKSPMVGVFYTKPSPDSEPFVQVGSRVKKGDTLCVIEAMKLLNEITAERDGEIVDICVQDGQMVEYAQVLFQMV
jgi:acetyl-CoA carboxylase biotin carboxyl carrier protein